MGSAAAQIRVEP